MAWGVLCSRCIGLKACDFKWFGSSRVCGVPRVSKVLGFLGFLEFRVFGV